MSLNTRGAKKKAGQPQSTPTPEDLGGPESTSSTTMHPEDPDDSSNNIVTLLQSTVTILTKLEPKTKMSSHKAECTLYDQDRKDILQGSTNQVGKF